MAKPLDYHISQTIKEYLGKQNQTKTITEISRTLDIGRNSIAKHLELLKIQGLVEERTVGQAKLWSLTATPFDSDKYGVSIRDNKFSKVDFPDPDGPTIEYIFPYSKLKEISFKTLIVLFFSYFLLIFLIFIKLFIF